MTAEGVHAPIRDGTNRRCSQTERLQHALMKRNLIVTTALGRMTVDKC
jgi:hypothetical protein